MVFDDIVKALHYGDLSAHGIFAVDLTKENTEKLLYSINQAAIDIYTRFPLLEKTLTILQRAGVTTYPLHKEYAFTNQPMAKDWFILDSKYEPFLGDVIKITGMCDEGGNEYKQNTLEHFCKVFYTSSPDVIELVDIEPENALFVNYRARHPVITETSQVIIPPNWLPAFYALVAHKIYAGGTAQEHVVKAGELMQKYELFCAQQREFGMSNEDAYSEFQLKFERGGWV